MNSIKRFGEEKLPDKECFCSFVKYETTGENGEKSNDHINNKDYLR